MKALPRKKIVIDDVAKSAGVSTATVSRVINGYEGVSPDVVFRVNNAIEDLGYIKPVKPKDRSSLNRKIGIVVPSIQNPYSSNLVKEIQDTLENFGYSVFITDSKNDPDKSINCVNSLLACGVSGLIYIPTHVKCEQEKKLANLEIPIVYLGRKVEQNNICFVGSETFIGSYNGAKYLLSLGHEEILYITGNRENVTVASGYSVDMDGYSGFLKAYEEQGLKFNTKNLISGDYNLTTSFDHVKDVLSKRTFTAIFTSGDIMAYGAYKAVLSAGLTIPGDISILGFDDLPMSSVMDLTTVSQNAFGIGQNAGLLLHDLIENRKEAPQNIILPTHLCIRSSCGINRR